MPPASGRIASSGRPIAKLAADFAAAMARLGPFGPAPSLAVGVSGGADSTALALLTQDWAAARGGCMTALIVDHGLRTDSAAEAALTQTRLAQRGMQARIITLSGLPTGARLQEKARAARHQALAAAARDAGALFLLLGHHADDQDETVAMRAARGPHGLEGMAAWTARADVILLRPLLGTRKADLQVYLRAQNMAWVEDPSNANPKFERARIRLTGTARAPASQAARQAAEHETAAFLAEHATLRPEGFAIIHAHKMPARALGALLRAIAGATYAPDLAATAALAETLRPATIGGVILAKSSKFGGTWLLAREPAACAPPIPATQNAIWDGRFKLHHPTPDATIGALGEAAPAFRRATNLPAIVLQSIPCLRHNNDITLAQATFQPPAPSTTHPFMG
jgi:tRNA(Ile)-lysidine synthase